jgi:hypothetical protein
MEDSSQIKQTFHEGSDPLWQATWTFDADGELVGYAIQGDLGNDCKEGDWSSTVTYGETCAPQGPGTDLCGSLGGAGGDGTGGGAAGAPP